MHACNRTTFSPAVVVDLSSAVKGTRHLTYSRENADYLVIVQIRDFSGELKIERHLTIVSQSEMPRY